MIVCQDMLLINKENILIYFLKNYVHTEWEFTYFIYYISI